MNEFGFEALIKAGEYFFSRDEAIRAVVKEATERVEEKAPEKLEEVKFDKVVKTKKRGRRAK